MFYDSSTLREIRELKEPSKLFEILTQPDRRGDSPYWTDIWHAIQHYRDFNCKSNSEYFLDITRIQEIEKFGLDYSYRDAAGNNFLHYIMGLSLSRSQDKRVKEPVLSEAVKQYVIDNTKNIWAPNNYNRNILFELLSYSSAGIKGENFINYISIYPELDIHIIDSSGRNLMFQALMNPAPFPLINYLIDEGLSLKQVDNQGFTLLHMFFSFNKGKEAENIFDKIFESVDNIAHKNRYKEAFIEHFLNCVHDKDVHQNHQKKYNFWINKSLTKIINGEFNKTRESLEGMIKILEDHKKDYQLHAVDKNCLRYQSAIKALNYFLLDMDVSHKIDKKTNSKLKI